MVRVNCAAIPATLIESELFGRERGAFTGALARQVGRFELANRSTIFLDEIGDLSADVQVKLLRVLEERQIERLGSPTAIHVDVRIVAATHRDLEQLIAAGTFRDDLYYRLNVFPIHVPPLRERAEDIPLLVWRFVDEFSRSFGKRIDAIARDNMAALQQYAWPGNIRELRNVVERAMIVASGPDSRLPLPAAPRRVKRQPAGRCRKGTHPDRARGRRAGGSAGSAVPPTSSDSSRRRSRPGWRNWGLSGRAYRRADADVLAPGVLGLEVEGHMSALDQLIPDPHLVELHRVRIAAPAGLVWQKVRHSALAQAWPIRALFALRNAMVRDDYGSSPTIRIDDFHSSEDRPGFQILVDDPPRELVVGAIGKVWRLRIPFVHVPTSHDFASFGEPGFVKVAWALRVRPSDTPDTLPD